jgi:hypothetical protein
MEHAKVPSSHHSSVLPPSDCSWRVRTTAAGAPVQGNGSGGRRCRASKRPRPDVSSVHSYHATVGVGIHVQLCVPGQPGPSTHWPGPTMACPGTAWILSRAGPGWPVDWRRSPDPARQLLHGPGRALSTVSPSVRVGPVPSQKTTELV